VDGFLGEQFALPVAVESCVRCASSRPWRDHHDLRRRPPDWLEFSYLANGCPPLSGKVVEFATESLRPKTRRAHPRHRSRRITPATICPKRNRDPMRGSLVSPIQHCPARLLSASPSLFASQSSKTSKQSNRQARASSSNLDKRPVSDDRSPVKLFQKG